jgi:hypothetical protein
MKFVDSGDLKKFISNVLISVFSTRILRTRHRRLGILFIISLISGGLISLALGTDCNWDLRNYHLYAPYAWQNDRLFFDIAPAQLQSFFNPFFHFPVYALFFGLMDWPHIFAFIMGLPAGLLGFLVLRIAWHHATSFYGPAPAAYIAAAIAGVMGMTGAAVLPGVGNSMGDVAITVPLAFAYLLVLREALRRDAGEWQMRLLPLVLAGFAAGLAGGLKLTVVPFAAAIGLMILLVLGFRAAAAAGTAMAVGFLAAFGPFAWEMWLATGNPLYPFYNNIFRVPDIPPLPFNDERFLPRSLLQAIFYPFWWLRTNSGLVGEVPMRDPRVALGYLSWVALVVMMFRGAAPSARRSVWLALGVAALSYAGWAGLFGIYRYAVQLEVLSVILVLLALATAWGLRAAPALTCFAVAAVFAISYTIHPNWGRCAYAAHILETDPIPIPAGALAVTLDESPLGYLVPLLPNDVRVLGLNTPFSSLAGEHGLSRRMHAAIAEHNGTIWSIAHSATPAAEREVVLRTYGLEPAGECILVRSSFQPGRPHRFCPVQKAKQTEQFVPPGNR